MAHVTLISVQSAVMDIQSMTVFPDSPFGVSALIHASLFSLPTISCLLCSSPLLPQ